MRSSRLMRRLALLALAALGVVSEPAPALAQAGYYVTPSLSVTETYDDNVFVVSSGRQDDFISRFTPGLRAGFQSEPLTLLGNYSFDSALYAEHPTLDEPMERQLAGLTLKYRPTTLLTLGFDGSYTRTQTPSELNLLTGIQIRRATADLYTLAPSAEYRFDPLTRGSANYSYSASDVSGGISSTAHLVTLRLLRDVTPTDTGRLTYGFNRFETEVSSSVASPSTAADSHYFTVGWTRHFTDLWEASADAGPRFTGGEVAPEVSASVTRRLQTGSASLAYTRSVTSVVGEVGTVRTESVSASLTLEPIRLLRVSASPRIFWTSPESGNTQGITRATVYAVDVGATYQFTRWLSGRVSYTFVSQQGRPDILRNTLTIGLDFVAPQRVY